jgi:hypothetical protein
VKTTREYTRILRLSQTHFYDAVIDKATSHSTKPASWQVAGYPAQAGIQIISKVTAQRFIAVLSAMRAVCLDWIPACAGMTKQNNSASQQVVEY